MPKYRILSLDGGGIRGLITAVWLTALEKKLGGKLRDHFDLVAGTSTGSILAAAVASGLPAETIVNLYVERGRDIFPAAASRRWNRLTRVFAEGISAPKYDDAGLDATLRKTFGDKTLGKLPKRLILLITSYDVQSRAALMFKNVKPDHKDVPLWEAVKSSCSAPTYFPAHLLQLNGVETPLVDGGVVANNPTACAIAEGVRRNSPSPEVTDPCELKDFVVVSMGTGKLTREITAAEARTWGAIEWALPIIDVLFDGAAQSVSYIAEQLIPQDRYFRFQTTLTNAYDDMDNADAPNLNALRAAANRFLDNEGGRAMLDKIAAILHA